MPRRKSHTGPDEDMPSFEQALAGLEAVVEAMENEQLPLEDLVAHYEKGSALLDRCESMLRDARDRIELITLRNHEETAAASGALPDPLPPVSTTSDDPDDSDDDNDDIRLF